MCSTLINLAFSWRYPEVIFHVILAFSRVTFSSIEPTGVYASLRVRHNENSMAVEDSKFPPPDPDPERFPPQPVPVPTPEPEEPAPDVINPGPEPLPA